MRKMIKEKPALCLVASATDDKAYHGFSVTLDFTFPETALTAEEMKSRLFAAVRSASMPNGRVTIRECKPKPLEGLPAL